MCLCPTISTLPSRNRVMLFGAIILFPKRMKSPCVKKGAWSGEEDTLLKKCIETYGPGKWHQVPQKAGLNRCRKSCRLRWLNYLQPNLKREGFEEDEIDLIIKMHKLLGNRHAGFHFFSAGTYGSLYFVRWSLIAGRLPGRTANDIKNYWNSHLSKKSGLKHNKYPPQTPEGKRDEVIRPQPRSFKAKVLSGGLIDVNIVKIQQQQEQQKQLCMLTPSEGHNMWMNNLLLEDDEASSPGSCNSAENGRLSKDDTQEVDLQRLQFDSSVFQWDDLLISNDWLMKY